MRSIYILCALIALCVSVSAQDPTKPWTDWSKKDAEKVLNGSGWGQTHTELPPEPVSTATVTNTRGGLAGTERSGESGEPKTSRSINYRARFLTAKPIREAFARMVVLAQPNAAAELKTQLQGFIDRDFGDYLVVTFSIESEDERVVKGATMALSRLNAEMLKDKVYLERKDGKKATFIDYKLPTGDGMGGKFVFARTLDGQPFLTDGADFVKFFFQFSDKQKVSMKFKVSSMMYGGKLEY